MDATQDSPWGHVCVRVWMRRARCATCCQELDVYIAGFTCKLFSQESGRRFHHKEIPDMFGSGSDIVTSH